MRQAGHLDAPGTAPAPAGEPGLDDAAVAQRSASGQVNEIPGTSSRSIGDIVRANVFTRINAILGVLLVVALLAGSPIDAAFGLVIIANSGIGIVQETRAKLTLDRLAVLNRTRPLVRRNGRSVAIDQSAVVIDDVIEIGPGDQIIVDGSMIEANGLEIDESLLTGEADYVAKPVGSPVMSGSFVVAGAGAYRATAVGQSSYASRLVEEAKRFALTRSELRAGIDRILGLITLVIIPAGALIIYTQVFASGQTLAPALVGMIAALVPMIPEGLVLMTSIAFALGVVRLGRIDCLVQDLAAIEALARVDVVCIDKTGTLTEQGMTLAEIMPLDEADVPLAERALAAIATIETRPNATTEAIRAGLTVAGFSGPVLQHVPFSSARKWQGVSWAGHGSWVLGAPDILLDPASEPAKRAGALAATGLRVLLLAKVDRLPADDAMSAVSPQLLVVMRQRLRPDARRTLDYFAAQGVAVKVLSGDNVASVEAVARALEIGNGASPRDARTLPDDPVELGEVLEAQSVFGRVMPEQKRAIVEALKGRGHTVAMLGDGVNDVLALKRANVGVAMGSGSPASRAVAQIVLLDNAFASLPKAVAEGRRVIANVERISNLFLCKTVYSALLALLVGAWGAAAFLLHAHPLPFPFLPRHVMISAWFTIGVPAFILSLAPSNDRAMPGFVARVLRFAIPAGIVVAMATLCTYFLVSGARITGTTHAGSSTAALITLIVVMLHVLSIICRPYEWWKLLLLAGSVAGYLVIFGWSWTQWLFALDLSDTRAVLTGLAIGLCGAVLVEVGYRLLRPSRDRAT